MNPLLMLDVKGLGENAVIPAPNLCIVLLTYLRTEMACRTVQGIIDKLDYPKELVFWYVADDGSPNSHMDDVFKTITDGGHRISGYHHEAFGKRPFCGIGWNKAVQKAHEVSDYIMLLEDDWVLNRPLDIRPFMWALLEQQDVGMMRLSGLTTDNIVQVVAHHGVHYLQYLRMGKMCYSGNPHIRHLRFTQFYGNFATDATPGNMEIIMDNRFHRFSDGPNIWRPADLPAWGIFDHIGRERTW